MRVLILSHYYPPERGSVRYAHDLAHGLSARGHEVTVIAEMPHFPMGRPYPGFGRWKPVVRDEQRVRVIRVPLVMGSNSQPVRRMLGFLTYMLSALPWICVMKRQDAVIASIPPATVAILGLLSGIVHRRRYLALLRDIEPLRALTLRGLAHKRRGRLLLRAFRWIYRLAAHVIAVHENERAVLLRWGIPEPRITVIGHGIDVERWSSAADTAPGPSIPRRAGRHLVVYAGTFGLVHGLPALMESLADPRIAALPFDFVFAGDGQHRGVCEQFLQRHHPDHIRILPSVDPGEVPAVLAQADLLLCSFRDDSDAALGTKFLEYCAAGKPIIVSGKSQAGLVVSQIGNGRACAAADRESLVRTLTDFASRPAYWRQQGQLGLEHARAHFAQRDRIDQWMTLLGTLPVGGAPTSRSK